MSATSSCLTDCRIWLRMLSILKFASSGCVYDAFRFDVSDGLNGLVNDVVVPRFPDIDSEYRPPPHFRNCCTPPDVLKFVWVIVDTLPAVKSCGALVALRFRVFTKTDGVYAARAWATPN